jgi:large subunit ribosomal protein L3
MRRGSLEYWPHRRAHKLLPRIRNWPASKTPAVLSFPAFKAGMTHVTLLDDSLSPSKGQEIFRPVTVLVFPKMFIYGVRFYSKKYLYEQAAGSVYDKALALKLGMKAVKSTNLEDAKKKLSEYTDITALAFADPSELSIGIKKQLRFEFPVGGNTNEEKLAFIEKMLGKEVKASEVMAPGEFVDVVTVSKGKGWEGPVHRFGVARQYHKSTGKIRHVGTLGAWHPPKVLFSVPQAGHLGFNYRTELNKRIIKMGSAQDGASVTPKGGFLEFGIVRSDYMLIDGSLPGGPNRFVRIRKALRPKVKVTVPKVIYISTESKQGA